MLFVGMGLHAQLPGYTLQPPANLQVSGVECASYLTWSKPQIAFGLIGYRIYRDGAYVATTSGQDTTWYYDLTVLPGTHEYSVSAYYDLLEYDYPGFFDESEPVGPEGLTILCSGILPFCETWNSGSYYHNGWGFHPNQGNWLISMVEGNPIPSAAFSGAPIDTAYRNTLFLADYRFNTGPFGCSTIHFDFDIRLDDLNATGSEKLTVEIFHNGYWHVADSFANNGSFNWDHRNYSFPVVVAERFKIRFIAHGENSTNIGNWYLDNICVTPFCNPPDSLSGEYNGEEVLLTWHPPVCDQTVLYSWIQQEITYHNGNPDTAAVGYFDWVYGAVFNLSTYQSALLYAVDFHHATWGYPCNWKYRIHVVNWSSLEEVATIGPFYTSDDGGWEEAIPLDSIGGLGGASIGIFLQPMGFVPDDAWPRLSSDNSGLQMTSLFGSFPDYEDLLPSTTGNYLMNLTILIPDEKEGFRTETLTPESDEQSIEGYNIYRRNEVSSPFSQINADLITDTAFVDVNPPAGFPVVQYYVTTVFQYAWCESIPSDTVDIIVTREPEFDAPVISIFPNPASDILSIKSDHLILNLRILDLMGKEILTVKNIQVPVHEINISNLSAGLYFAEIFTNNGSKLVKISVRK